MKKQPWRDYIKDAKSISKDLKDGHILNAKYSSPYKRRFRKFNRKAKEMTKTYSDKAWGNDTEGGARYFETTYGKTRRRKFKRGICLKVKVNTRDKWGLIMGMIKGLLFKRNILNLKIPAKNIKYLSRF